VIFNCEDNFIFIVDRSGFLANRLRIIRFIGSGERSVNEIVSATGLSQPLVSHHLRVLREKQVLEPRRQGPFVLYAVKDPRLLDALGIFLQLTINIENMDMCKKMMAGMGPNRNADQLATPEIQTLFEEWARQMDSEVLGLVESGEEMDSNGMAAQLKISRESLLYFLTRLARQGKIDLKPIKK
jgi:DNA-binding transcriptional ArsR family regulator